MDEKKNATNHERVQVEETVAHFLHTFARVPPLTPPPLPLSKYNWYDL